MTRDKLWNIGDNLVKYEKFALILLLGKYNIDAYEYNERVEGGHTMFLAEAAQQSESTYQHFDLFMIAFTLLLIWAVLRQVKQRPRNLFALGFAVVSLLVFLYADWVMVQGW